MHALDGNGPYVTDEDVRNIVDTIKGPILLRQGGAFLFRTQISQILTDLVAEREINKLTRNRRQAECRMSSLKFCRGAKKEDDSQITDNTEMGRPNVLKIVSKNGLTGKILCFNGSPA